MNTSYRKVFRELRFYKGRTAAAFIGILIGIFSIGFVLSSYSILLREMDGNYMETNPASFVLTVNDLDENGLTYIQEMYPDNSVEARKIIQGRIYRDNGTYGTIYLYAFQDFSNQTVDTMTLEQGEFPISSNQMVLERDSLNNLLNLQQGYNEKVILKFPYGSEMEIELTGLVHAPGLPPASMEKFSYGFMTLEGLQALGYEGWYDEIHFVSADNWQDREAMYLLADEVSEELENAGYEVTQTKVPEPGKHPHNDQLQSLLFLLQAFTVISLLVACMIIVNLFNSIMATQTKQIAIMKATGAITRKIAMPYFLYVLLISLCAVLVSIPMTQIGCRFYSDIAAGMLNFKISDYSIDYWVYIILILSGLIIPLAAAFAPVYKSSKITVKDGLAEQSNEKVRSRKSPVQIFFASVNTKVKIPVGNIFRRSKRTLIGVAALAAGGIIFMTAQNIVASINQTVSDTMSTFSYNYDIRLAGNYDKQEIIFALSELESIEKIELYQSGKAKLIRQNGYESSYYTIKAISPDSELFSLFTFSNNLENSVVINQGILDDENWIDLNETVFIEINGQRVEVVISEVVNEVPPTPTIYISLNTYEQLFGSDTGVQGIMLSAAETANLSKIAADVESKLAGMNVDIAENWNITLLRESFVDHLKLIVDFLSIVAALAVIVGGLSIASITGINVSERRREIGVLRAVGANTHQTVFMFSVEAALMGLAGWLLGFLLSIPISVWAGNYFGQIFLSSNLNNSISISGLLFWFALSLVTACISGFIPAKKAAAAPLREMLAYE